MRALRKALGKGAEEAAPFFPAERFSSFCTIDTGQLQGVSVRTLLR
jgi:hypothetical protein